MEDINGEDINSEDCKSENIGKTATLKENEWHWEFKEISQEQVDELEKLMEYTYGNTVYYGHRFENILTGKVKTNWNWGAFLFVWAWLLYRKMYAYGFAFISLIFLSMLLDFTPIGAVFNNLLTIVGSFGLGIWGNNLYLKSLQKKIAMEADLPEDEKEKFILKHRGTSMGAVAVGVLSLIAFGILYITILAYSL